jgi:hypothetical protein
MDLRYIALERSQGLSGQRGVKAAEIGAITLLYAPDLKALIRGSLQAPELRGAKEPLLPEPI